ncbi:hypothetical protein [Caldibacillus thermoamylovorans]|uniref:Uncharacterized protein n=1 Tax=Caldibacillus thermoamylovorans TaxID=35841 RepID=A0ABD4A538_9BACI|nr:hypothetical protein [Caldibacillus thermoamylovorans]KIO72206.1 hypothetical protein B4167_0563 [Caldibacillus thermoamylovorans]
MTTRFILVAIFSRKTLSFGDEAHSRHHFQPKNSIFSRKTPLFDDENLSRHHFQAGNPIF